MTSSILGILTSKSIRIDNTQTVSQFPNVHQNVHAGLMSHNYNVPSVYSVGQTIPVSVSQTGSQSVQTPHKTGGEHRLSAPTEIFNFPQLAFQPC